MAQVRNASGVAIVGSAKRVSSNFRRGRRLSILNTYPRRIEHFWKWRLRMSDLLKVSRQRTHMYGLSPVWRSMCLFLQSWSTIAGSQSRIGLYEQVFCVKVGFCAVRARKFAIRILLRDLCLGRGRPGGRRSRPTGRTGENTSTTLGSNDVSWLIAILHQGGLSHHGALRVRRSQTTLRHHPTGGHGPQDGRGSTTRRRGWGDGLRMSRRHGRLGHHGRRGGVRLLVLLVGVVHHRIC